MAEGGYCSGYTRPMDREEVVAALRKHKPELAERFGVEKLALFGSFARNKASGDSDVDILVGFNEPATSGAFFGVQFYIEDVLHRSVDLVTTKALRPELRSQVERDAIYV